MKNYFHKKPVQAMPMNHNRFQEVYKYGSATHPDMEGYMVHDGQSITWVEKEKFDAEFEAGPEIEETFPTVIRPVAETLGTTEV